MQTELKNISIKSGAGFTLIEMLVAMAILISIMGFGLFLSMDYYRSFIFFHEKDLVISILHKARSQSLANINEKKHGVHFETDQYILFEGDVYSPIDPNNVLFDSSQTVSHSGMTEVVFNQLTGKATVLPSGANLILKDNIRPDVVIYINNEGKIY